MDMEERYRLIMSTIFNAIGCRVEVEKMIATGRIDMVVEATNYIGCPVRCTNFSSLS